MAANKTGTIYKINGPIIQLKQDVGFAMNEMVYVGKERLVGEVIGLSVETTTIQVYEETTGIRPGETVIGTGAPVTVTLAPGILKISRRVSGLSGASPAPASVLCPFQSGRLTSRIAVRTT